MFTISGLYPRAAALAVATLAAAFPFATPAQTATSARVTGSFGGQVWDGTVQGSFSCTGTPTCTGEYTMTERSANCSNALQISGGFVLSGIDVAQPGAVSGLVVLENAGYDTERRPDGTCAIVAGSVGPDAVAYRGSYDPSTGTAFSFVVEEGVTVSGSFRVEGATTSTTANNTQLSGEFSGSDASGSFRLSFTCNGAPSCAGQYSAEEVLQGCSNTIRLSGPYVMTGLDLSSSGSIQGALAGDLLDYEVDRRPDGTCTVVAQTQLAGTAPYSGTWNASTGTGSFSLSPEPGMVFTGTLKGDAVPPPVFPMTVTSNITTSTATASADIQYRSQDVGSTGSVYVFALAPSSRVQGGSAAKAMKVGYAKGVAAKADAPVACVLAQLSQSGQMVAVTADQLQAYLSGVLSAQGAAVTILDGVPTSTVAGATFFVGYGSSGSSMIDNGVNRGAVTVPGSLVCEPGPPQKGWWWNPLEGGRGFSLEARGNNIFFAAFLYDVSGRSTWHVSTGPVSLDGSYYTGDLLSARGGQTLGGAYPGFPTLASVGRITLTFNNATTGTMVWPGGTVPIERFNIVPNGMNLAPVAGEPESGWWWNEQEAGRGFFMEWQGGNLDIAGYMYDDPGNSVWYLTTGPIGGTATSRSFAGSWWSFGNGQTLLGPWKPHAQLSDNVAPVTIQFNGPDKATMSLPNGRTANLVRHRF